jgi:hypothetical protein
MRLMLDLNVLLDVVQRREPFYAASAAVLSLVVGGKAVGWVPGHAVTTIHYLISRYEGQARADEVVDWLLAHVEVAPQEKVQVLRARNLGLQDFEDAVVASAAEASGCDLVVTRNVADFRGSPVPAVTPEELLSRK